MPQFMANHTIIVVEKNAELDDKGKVIRPAVLKTINEGEIVECNDEQFEAYKADKAAKTKSQAEEWLKKKGLIAKDDGDQIASGNLIGTDGVGLNQTGTLAGGNARQAPGGETSKVSQGSTETNTTDGQAASTTNKTEGGDKAGTGTKAPTGGTKTDGKPENQSPF